MLIYNGTKGQFDKDVISGSIADKINAAFFEHGLTHENESEYMSWRNSLSKMQQVLDAPYFSNELQIAIEYQIPQTAKRVDFIIAGESADGASNAIIIELKQWASARQTSRDCVVKAFTGGRERDVAHPSYQAYSYAMTIANYNSTINSDRIGLFPCAYLHNYKPEYANEIICDRYNDIISEAPIFINSDEEKLRSFIKKYVSRPSKLNIMYEIDNGKIKPTKAVQDALEGMLKGNDEFFLIDEQKVVFETVKKIVMNALKHGKKFTVIIEGGPGTGKSVVAIQLLASLIKNNYSAQYVTKNAAPRNVYFKKLQQSNYKLGYIKNLFKSSGSFVNSASDEIDCLIIDESHRLVEKSGYYSNNGENQIKELINAAKVSVFFIDEAQIVTAKDIGRISNIKKWAYSLKSNVYHNESTVLHSQFRCNGSNDYISLLDDLLFNGIYTQRKLEMDYEIKVFESPSAMRNAIREKNMINNKSRMLAGYCYQWRTKNNPAPDLFDIELEDGFKAKWNFNTTSTWAIDEDTFEQVGCIHTCQGLEFDYVGVIIGKDLQYINGRIMTDPAQHPRSDISFKDSTGRLCPQNEADMIIRNTYKTLLTRGQKGCYIYCEEPSLRQLIRGLIE